MSTIEELGYDPQQAAHAALCIYEFLYENQDGICCQSWDKYRAQHGIMAARDEITYFAAKTEIYLSSLTDKQREELYDSITWDWEWIPGVMEGLQQADNGKHWFECDVLDIAKVSVDLLTKVKQNGRL